MGRRQHPLFSRWYQLRYNCDNPNMPEYHLYGGRGISYDPRWRNFEVFVSDIESTIGEMPFPGAILDRVNNDGGYYANNLRWSTPAENHQNTRRNRMMKYRGRTQCINNWVKELDLPRWLAYKLASKGQTMAQIVREAKKRKK